MLHFVISVSRDISCNSSSRVRHYGSCNLLVSVPFKSFLFIFDLNNFLFFCYFFIICAFSLRKPARYPRLFFGAFDARFSLALLLLMPKILYFLYFVDGLRHYYKSILLSRIVVCLLLCHGGYERWIKVQFLPDMLKTDTVV